MAIFNSYVKLPEGTPNFSMWTFYVENPFCFSKIRWKWMMTRVTPISVKFHIWPWLWEDFCWGIYCWYTLRLFQSQLWKTAIFDRSKTNPADLAPAHDCPKIVGSLWRQRDFMWQTTIKKKHPLYCGLQPLQGFVLQNPTNEQSGLFSSPHERSYSFASCGQQVEATVFPSPLLTSNVLEQQNIAFALDLGTNDITPHPTTPHA